MKCAPPAGRFTNECNFSEGTHPLGIPWDDWKAAHYYSPLISMIRCIGLQDQLYTCFYQFTLMDELLTFS